jgi:hypothetical protein
MQQNKTQDEELLIATRVFAEALCARDFRTLASMLADDGEFNVFRKDGEIRHAKKRGFITWLKKRLALFPAEEFDYYIDQCMNCSIGDPIIVLKNPLWLRSEISVFDRPHAGIRLVLEDSKIKEIVFCGLMFQTCNEPEFSRKQKRE